MRTGEQASAPGAFLVVAAGLALLGAAAASGGQFEVAVGQNVKAVPLYEVFEIDFKHERRYRSPHTDVSVHVVLKSPSGRRVKVGGFFYGSTQPTKIVMRKVKRSGRERDEPRYMTGRPNLWKARYAPGEIGDWSFRYEFATTKGGKAEGTGSFRCVKGRAPSRGFLRQNPSNPFLWVFDDGSPYFPIGLQTGLGDNFGAGTVLSAMALEGPIRTDRPGRKLPPGAMYQPGPSSNPVNGDEYFRRYARAGFNFVRHPGHNAPRAVSCHGPGNVHEGVMTDEFLRHARKYDMRIMFCIFGWMAPDEPDNAEVMAKLKRALDYTVARWGAYVDIWELMNEDKRLSAKWYEIMTAHLRSIDPYRHPITTSFERPEIEGIDVSSPHWYDNRKDELKSDQLAATRAKNWKKFNKPVIVGEHGSSGADKNGIGGVWDERSAVRMRLRNWAALFNEISLVFWNTSYAKDGHRMNMWLGPLERQYVRAMQGLATRLDAGMRMVPVGTSGKNVRAYGLASEERAAVYLHYHATHERTMSGLWIQMDLPERASKGYWYSPETAAIIRRIDIKKGQTELAVPDFTIDIALLVANDGPPDIDSDGRPNDEDPDDDNDGVPDDRDAFPLEPEEWGDKDGDLIGDVLDADDSPADGIGDDENGNGTPDRDEQDIDGDGVPRSKAAPWDAFPFDPKEWRDTDGDGVGDNADPDDDGDGYTDEEERAAGSDPLSRVSIPLR